LTGHTLKKFYGEYSLCKKRKPGTREKIGSSKKNEEILNVGLGSSVQEKSCMRSERKGPKKLLSKRGRGARKFKGGDLEGGGREFWKERFGKGKRGVALAFGWDSRKKRESDKQEST